MQFRFPSWRQVGVAVAALSVVTLSFVTISERARAFDVLWLPTGTGDYNNGANWADVGTTVGRGVVPSGAFEEEGVISNGGTATLAVTASDTPGGVVLGRTATDSGTLTINSGGVLTSIVTASTSGNIVVGQAGHGTLNVAGTGSLTAPGLNVGGLATSQANFSGNASVSISGTSTIGRGLRITGPSVNFSSNVVTLQANSVVTHEITSASAHSPIKSAGNATLNGTIAVQFNGVTPTAGTYWNLVDALAIPGNFTNMSANGDVQVTGAPPTPLGSSYRLRRTPGGTNGLLLQVGLEKYLVLRVNRDTGEMTIRNPEGAAVTGLTGYTVTSAIGSMAPTYKGISGAPAGDAGWQKAPLNSATGLAEFKPTGVFDVSSNATSVSLGNGFNKFSTSDDPIGSFSEDLVFDYTTHSGAIVRGVIEYVGTPFLNNVALFVDPSNGMASLKNDTANAITLDGYSIVSSTGALSAAGWTSLADRPGQYPNWQESPTSANLLAEQNPSAPMAIPAGESITLGSIGNFATDAAKAGLSLRYILGTEQAQQNGAVFFGAAATGPQGDFDGNGRVDGQDLLTWQRGGSPNPLSQGDLDLWRANYGQGGGAAASAAVPEPGTLALAGVAAAFAVVRRRRND